MRFEQAKPLHRNALEVENLGHRYAGAEAAVFSGLTTIIEAGERIAIVGANGVGKSTLLRAMAGEAVSGLNASLGRIRWADNADVGYMAQDVYPDFESEQTITDWIGRYTQEGDDEQAVRSILGRMLFSGDDVRKAVRVLSGGEKHRMSFGRLMLGRHNVLLMDEPTSALDDHNAEQVIAMLEEQALQTGAALIIVTHDKRLKDRFQKQITL
jgi:ATPase subunit of ABC transporter with duplicated ATPase domains